MLCINTISLQINVIRDKSKWFTIGARCISTKLPSSRKLKVGCFKAVSRRDFLQKKVIHQRFATFCLPTPLFFEGQDLDENGSYFLVEQIRRSSWDWDKNHHFIARSKRKKSTTKKGFDFATCCQKLELSTFATTIRCVPKNFKHWDLMWRHFMPWSNFPKQEWNVLTKNEDLSSKNPQRSLWCSCRSPLKDDF